MTHDTAEITNNPNICSFSLLTSEEQKRSKLYPKAWSYGRGIATSNDSSDAAIPTHRASSN